MIRLATSTPGHVQVNRWLAAVHSRTPEIRLQWSLCFYFSSVGSTALPLRNIKHFFIFSFYSNGHLHPVFKNRREITPWQFQAMAKRIISNFKFTATNEEGFDRRKVIQTSKNSSIVMKTQKFTEKCASGQCLALAAAQAVLEFCMLRRLIDK